MLSSCFSLLVLACFSALATAAPQYWISATTAGATTQLFNTTSAQKSAPKDSVQITTFNFSATAPVDAATGQASGKATFAPLTVVRTLDKNTPGVFQAFATRRVLKSVVLSALEQDQTGAFTKTLSYTLTNAVITSILHDGEKDGMTETLAFRYQSIEVTYLTSTAKFDVLGGVA